MTLTFPHVAAVLFLFVSSICWPIIALVNFKQGKTDWTVISLFVGWITAVTFGATLQELVR